MKLVFILIPIIYLFLLTLIKKIPHLYVEKMNKFTDIFSHTSDKRAIYYNFVSAFEWPIKTIILSTISILALKNLENI